MSVSEQVTMPPSSTTAAPHTAPASLGGARRGGFPRFLIVVLVIIGVAGGLGWYWHEHTAGSGAAPEKGAAGPSEASEPAAQDTGEKTRVEYVNPAKGGIELTTRQPGTVQAFQYADIEANSVNGYLVEQKTKQGGFVDIGTRVKLGDLLAQIDDPPLVKEAQQAKAVIEQRKAEIEQAKAEVDTAKAMKLAKDAAVQQSEAAVIRAEANKKYRQIQSDRIADLARLKTVDQRYADEEHAHLDEAIGDLATAKAAVLTAMAEADAAKAKVLDAEAKVLTAKADLEVAKSNYERLQELVKFLDIRSPYEGVVTKRVYHQGAYIRSTGGSSGPLFTVARTDLMRVIVAIPEADVPYCRPGNPAEVQLDALKGRVFNGVVSRTAEAEDPVRKTMRIEIDLENKDGTLREGMFGRALVHLQAASGEMHLPSQAVQVDRKSGKNYVYVVENEKAVRKPVIVGNDDGIHAELMSGSKVALTDKVVSTYNGTMFDGVPVIAEKQTEKKKEAE